MSLNLRLYFSYQRFFFSILMKISQAVLFVLGLLSALLGVVSLICSSAISALLSKSDITDSITFNSAADRQSVLAAVFLGSFFLLIFGGSYIRCVFLKPSGKIGVLIAVSAGLLTVALFIVSITPDVFTSMKFYIDSSKYPSSFFPSDIRNHSKTFLLRPRFKSLQQLCRLFLLVSAFVKMHSNFEPAIRLHWIRCSHSWCCPLP